MNKLINVILISFFAVLTANNYIGYSLYIPVLFILGNKNKRNLILLIPISVISSFIFRKDIFHITIILNVLYLIYVFLFKKVLSKYHNLYTESIFIILLNVTSYLLLNNDYSQRLLIIYLGCCFGSSLIYLFFVYNLQCALNNKGSLYSYCNVEVVMFFISVFGSCNINYNINISEFLTLFFIMYLSTSGYTYHSLFFSLCLSLYYMLYLNINYAFIFPFITCLFTLNGLWGSIMFITICFIVWISKQQYIKELYLQLAILTTVFFEIVRGSLIMNKTKEEEIYKDAYKKSIEALNNEVIGFASFLDSYSKDFAINSEYVKKMNDAVESLKNCCCNYCYSRDSCFRNNKGILYKYFSEIILYSKRSDYSSDTFVHLKKCPYVNELIKQGAIINNKYDIDNTNVKSNALISSISGISNILRSYTIDNSLKKEIDYKVIYKIKRALSDYGFNICYFNPKKLIINDFLIEIGFRNVSYNEVYSDIEKICGNFIELGVSSVFKESNKGKLYINIVPKINFSIDYGFCNLSSSENNVSGDNYIIKDINNTKSIAVISDGMGKGYEANSLSSKTLELIDRITSFQMESSTCIQIINTFYYIQDYMEKYSTLDYLEIDKLKGKVNFFKLGASSSYLFNKNGKCKIIENKSLPFGLEEVTESVEYDINDGDMIIMASDGMFDTSYNKEEIEKYIKGIMHLPSQKIVYEITNMIKYNNRIDDDDMSIIVLKLSKA